MSTPEDPPRWSDDAEAPAGLSALFSAARGDGATDTELANLRSRLGPVLDSAPAATSPGSAPLLLKLGAGALAAALALGGFAYWRQRARVPVASPTPAPATSVAAKEAALEPAASEAPSVPVVTPPIAPVASITKQRGAPVSDPARELGTTQTEAQLLEQARSELAASPARALSATQKHAALFPHGLLAQEREVIAISALRRLGRTAEAEARAARFDQHYPNSAHQQVVDSPSTR